MRNSKQLLVEGLELRTPLAADAVGVVSDPIPGDANSDGVFDSSDIVQVMQVGEYEDLIPNNSTWGEGDFDGDGDFGSADLICALSKSIYEPTPAGHLPGDANEDGVFNSTDLVLALYHGEYEDDQLGNSTWQEGDWNGDLDFTTADLILAMNVNKYVE